ncbi:MAG: FecR domain-containing protein, partial [Spirochaetia bacterium]|nr:FecR domain-containing protein [Spirochaetia bacterium]
AAEIVTARGTVNVRKSGSAPSALKVKDRVSGGDLIITGEDGFARVKFRDESVITVQGSSRYLISEDSDPSDKGGSKSMLVSGSLSADLSKIKKIYKDKDESYKIYTPTAVCGVRGTKFDIYSDKNGKSLTAVGEGEIAVSGDTLSDDARVSGGQSVKSGDGFKSDKGGAVSKDKGKIPSQKEVSKALGDKPKPDAEYEKYYIGLVQDLASRIAKMKTEYDSKEVDAGKILEEARKLPDSDTKKNSLFDKARVMGLERFIVGKTILHRVNQFRGYMTLLENSSTTVPEAQKVEEIFQAVTKK